MPNIIVEENGKQRLKEDVDFADEIIKLKNKKDHWAVIDKLLEKWLSTSPEEVEALKIQIEDHREMLIDKDFGTTKGGKDFDRRYTLVFPLKLMLMIRAIYATEELTIDQDFFREFIQRYPNFKIASKT
jgi:hypothetical protein